MARIPLGTLPAFRAVARTQNLRAAADELHLTHSAISQQIRLLEQQLGFALFDRRGRRVVLNAAGSALQRSVEAALTRVDEGVRAAAAAAAGAAQRVRLTMVPSFAQRWLLPRMARWRERHPDIALELHASQQIVDLTREGFHAAVRQGLGQWRGLHAERLIDSPLIALGSPAAARRLAGQATVSLAAEPLLGDGDLWQRWFALDDCRCHVQPVASFNDAGLMLQAAEQDIGIALGRELLAADALREGRLVRLSPLALGEELAQSYWLAVPTELVGWPPLEALREWLLDELADAAAALTSSALPAPIAAAAANAAKTARRGRAAARR